MTRRARRPEIDAFNLYEGQSLAGKYQVLSRLGEGWEGEVYLVRERITGVERAIKLFFPHRNERDKTFRFYARKLHKLRHCPIVIQYHGQDRLFFRNLPITALVSEYVDGQLLSAFLAQQPGKRLQPFQAVHLLHALAAGMEAVHAMGEYHGDLHSQNIIVERYGLGFDLKLLDLFHWRSPMTENIQEDVVDLVKIFYEALGGKKHYAKLPAEVKAICCGLKRTLILKKFRTAGKLRTYLEDLQWS